MPRILFAFAALVLPTSLSGQRLAPLPVYGNSWMVASPIVLRFDRARADSATAIPRTYWLEGGVIGAITVGVLGTLWFSGMSESDHGVGSTIAVGALCAAVGFAPGALIGGQFHKPEPTRPRAP